MNTANLKHMLVSTVKAAARAAAVGAAVAFLTVIANATPAISTEFHLSPAATGQIVGIILLVRSALESKGV